MTHYSGQCRCGTVRFEVSGSPLLTAACHCTDCQRMTAGPFSLSALYAEDQFELVSGDVVVGDCNSTGQHHFCAKCHSWMYTKPGGLDGMINVRTPLLDNAAGFPPFAEFYCDEALPGAQSGAPQSYGRAPNIDSFLALSEKYAEWGHRPD